MSPATTTLELFPPSEESTSSAAASPVSPGQAPGSEWARKMTVISGRQCLRLSSASGPLGSLERALLESSAWGSTKSWLTWRPSTTPQGRLLFRLALLAPHTSGIGSGSWLATATATGNQLAPSMMKHAGCRAYLPTPTVRDWKGGGKAVIRKDGKSRMDMLDWVVEVDGTGRLNPEFCEWLMGYPIGHTELKPSEMPSSHRSRKSSGEQS